MDFKTLFANHMQAEADHHAARRITKYRQASREEWILPDRQIPIGKLHQWADDWYTVEKFLASL